MKKIKSLIGLVTVVLLTSACDSSQKKTSTQPPQQDSSNLSFTKNWFNAWELVSSEVFHLPADIPPEMLFFDDTYVYTTSKISAPEGEQIDGPPFLGEKLSWRKAAHKGELTLPDGQKVPVGLMIFAGPLREGGSFFVMSAPSYWRAAGVTSEEFSLDALMTTVFLHEFAHTRQSKGFTPRVNAIETSHVFKDVQLSDDIVQDYFKKDSNYIRDFRTEADKFYQAAFAQSEVEAKSLTWQGIQLLKSRQAKYFTKDKVILTELDNIFLSMEGVGQYAGFAWLIHPKGGNFPFETAVKGMRRKRNRWSQEEGLALFLVLTKLTKPDWATSMFSEKPKVVVALLEEALQEEPLSLHI